MKEHFCSVEKTWIAYEDKCNWCDESEGSMTQDELQELINQCQEEHGWGANFFDYEKFAKLVASKEREAIIQIIKTTPFSNWFQADVIEAIRARGEQA